MEGRALNSIHSCKLQTQGQSFCACSERCLFPISLSIKTFIKLESNKSLHMRRTICKIINTHLLFQTKGLGTKTFCFLWGFFLFLFFSLENLLLTLTKANHESMSPAKCWGRFFFCCFFFCLFVCF